MIKKRENINLRMGVIYIALILTWVIYAVATKGNFISTRNLSNLARQMATVCILSCGSTMVIISGGIDLSGGMAVAFLGGITGTLIVQHGLPFYIVIPIVLLCGLVLGFINGIIISHTGLAPFIVTLGTQLVCRGLVLAVTGGLTIAPFPANFRTIGQSYLPGFIGWGLGAIAIALMLFLRIKARNDRIRYKFDVDSLSMTIAKWFAGSVGIAVFIFVMNDYQGIPVPVLIMISMVIIFSFVTQKTTFGRSIYAIGGNREAAQFAGINVKRNQTIVYMMYSMLAAVAAIVLVARMNASIPNGGEGMELDAVAATVIGGTSMRGGIGKVSGAILGGLFMASIDNALSMMNVNILWQYIVKGVILVAAVVFDTTMRNKKAKVKA